MEWDRGQAATEFVKDTKALWGEDLWVGRVQPAGSRQQERGKAGVRASDRIRDVL